MDRGAWRAAVPGVAESGTRLRDYAQQHGAEDQTDSLDLTSSQPRPVGSGLAGNWLPV